MGNPRTYSSKFLSGSLPRRLEYPELRFNVKDVGSAVTFERPRKVFQLGKSALLIDCWIMLRRGTLNFEGDSERGFDEDDDGIWISKTSFKDFRG